ncbi:hypothetical protein AWZ03_011164 [Drosophila navojoa]|uniref:Uncharacterized protein n=2 Tax=mojavensis species complex TaxID=198037 RepID=B4K522_DROMO|nr:uncharacterized protein LOC6572423 [Drosophila mojavensis]XP_030243798.1 uncharacterized protein LOC115564068 [Drosophila navojoa]EDW13993.1 uncharacterized protein Dmoj_GI24025 [Drosophila mojavensis]TDG42416.1 hypothetical protein AWZ03_011164 [Drosophila navojoa]
MSHQCSCGRDLNNNYVSYTNAYANANTGLDREANANASSKANASHHTQLTAKVMFGTVGAIKELRDKEQQQQSRHAATRAGDRRQ